ncbi:50S ribosomal protein L22 [Saccharicrinis fermentans]|uniref:Large ribosomal subunit protein uL22 n=1 Tax=Saccharicrinis fermentans DSM 9555 = JCM 21142 TaxID=869213 RepID=W7Y3M3_9BACT|nr:50S ribosomal protein L22 [Saccharicrinis fermentans]GAF02612.1 50S ribosomal protein L22 [Saccharicrinis fermentans DSM 9555 = JCM 21142]
MGARKRLRAEQNKEAKKQVSFASLRNVPTSPRKMRLVADMIRGKEVNLALDLLKYSSKEASRRVEKLLLSAIANWKEKNEGVRMEDANLVVKSINVDSARILKRLRPAPQGRAHRIRKRSNHVTIYIDSNVNNKEEIKVS